MLTVSLLIAYFSKKSSLNIELGVMFLDKFLFLFLVYWCQTTYRSMWKLSAYYLLSLIGTFIENSDCLICHCARSTRISAWNYRRQAILVSWNTEFHLGSKMGKKRRSPDSIPFLYSPSIKPKRSICLVWFGFGLVCFLLHIFSLD